MREVWRDFSGENALAQVERIVAFGPRSPASEGSRQVRDYIGDTLREAGWHVTEQTFHGETPKGPIAFTNLIARYAGTSTTAPDALPPLGQRVILCTHYDTKALKNVDFVGANGGGSGAGALLEAARALSLEPRLSRQIELVFFDGSEALAQFTATDGLYGSRSYAANLTDTGRCEQFRAAIVWGMIGNKDLKITLLPDTEPDLARRLLAAASASGLEHRFSRHNRPEWGDHVPLGHVGIPCLPLTDCTYAYRHTADDTVDKLSAESFEEIGRITFRMVTGMLSEMKQEE